MELVGARGAAKGQTHGTTAFRGWPGCTRPTEANRKSRVCSRENSLRIPPSPGYGASARGWDLTGTGQAQRSRGEAGKILLLPCTVRSSCQLSTATPVTLRILSALRRNAHACVTRVPGEAALPPRAQLPITQRCHPSGPGLRHRAAQPVGPAARGARWLPPSPRRGRAGQAAHRPAARPAQAAPGPAPGALPAPPPHRPGAGAERGCRRRDRGPHGGGGAPSPRAAGEPRARRGRGRRRAPRSALFTGSAAGHGPAAQRIAAGPGLGPATFGLGLRAPGGGRPAGGRAELPPGARRAGEAPAGPAGAAASAPPPRAGNAGGRAPSEPARGGAAARPAPWRGGRAPRGGRRLTVRGRGGPRSGALVPPGAEAGGGGGGPGPARGGGEAKEQGGGGGGGGAGPVRTGPVAHSPAATAAGPRLRPRHVPCARPPRAACADVTAPPAGPRPQEAHPPPASDRGRSPPRRHRPRARRRQRRTREAPSLYSLPVTAPTTGAATAAPRPRPAGVRAPAPAAPHKALWQHREPGAHRAGSHRQTRTWPYHPPAHAAALP